MRRRRRYLTLLSINTHRHSRPSTTFSIHIVIFRSLRKEFHRTSRNMGSSPKKIAIIIGSTRVNRIGDQVADFVKSTLAAEQTKVTVALTLVDIKSFNLPVFDEAVMPAIVPMQA